MPSIKIVCGCGATLEYSGKVLSVANRSRDFLYHHTDCSKFPKLKPGEILETIDNVTDFENILREAVTEPLVKIATESERIANYLETIKQQNSGMFWPQNQGKG